MRYNWRLTNVNFAYNHISGEGITDYAEALSSYKNESQIKSINLAKQNYITAEWGADLAKALWVAWFPPQNIDISYNFFDEETGWLLAEAAEN